MTIKITSAFTGCTLALFSFGCMTLNFVVVLVEYREICNDGKQTYCLDGNPVFLWVITKYYYCVYIFRAQNYLDVRVFLKKKRLFVYLVL